MPGKRRADRRGRPTPPPTAPQPPAGATPSAGATVVPPPTSRRQLREERRQRRRRRRLAGIMAIVAAVAAAGVAIGIGVHRATSGSSTPKDTETTLLISLQGADGNAVASMLAAHDSAAKQGLELLVPSRLITEVCGFGTQQFGQIVALPQGERLAQRTLSQVLDGVAIDGTWTVSLDQLKRLVNAVGGVTVDVDVDVAQTQGGATVVVVPAGKQQRLDGARAVDFATFLGAGEDATAVLSRFQSVFQAVVRALPSKPEQAAQVLTSTGVKASVPTPDLATLLTSLARDDAGDALLPVDVPTKTIDSGGGPASYRLDATEASKLVRSRLAASLPKTVGPKRPTVLIENGVGTSGLVESACNRLLPAGYGFAGSGNAPSFNYPKSQVIVFDSSVASARVGNDIARLLRLSEDDVVVSSQGQNVADVVVILGGDYKP